MPDAPEHIYRGDFWAITPEAYQRWAEIQKLPVDQQRDAYDVAFSHPFWPSYDAAQPYELRDGVALLPVRGMFTKRGWWPGDMGGGDMIRSALHQALADTDVKAVLLVIDSPGGTVDGTQALADFVYDARDVKPIRAFADGMMCSAAYWIGSAAEKIYCEFTSDVGSIGVLTTHVDQSRALENHGLRITYLHAGEFKVLGNSVEPLSDKAREYIQTGINEIYELFVDSVARNRGVDRNTALSMADGKVFLGREALEVGLVDGICNLDQCVQKIREEIEMGKELTVEGLRSEHPDLVASIEQECTARIEADQQEKQDEAIKEAATQAAEAAQERVLELHTAVFGADQGLRFATLTRSGIQPEQAAAIMACAPQEKSDTASAMLAALEQSHEPELAAPSGKKAKPSNTEAKWNSDESLRSEFGGNFEAYQAYQEAVESGRVRILNGKEG